MNSDLYLERSNESTRSSHPANFELTLLSETLLSERLLSELRFAARRIKQVWPELKADPVRVITRQARLLASELASAHSRPQMALGVIASLVTVTALALIVIGIDNRAANRTRHADADELELVATTHLPATGDDTSKPGIGAAGDKGRVGFRDGRGEGSRTDPARARGGGGGGTRAQLRASQGRPPVPSEIPAPIPTAAVRLPQTLPVAGIDLDPALWRKLDYSAYGDPRSKSVTPSNGSGDGGGVGTGRGTGIGEGDGGGFGPGRNGNMGGGEKGLGSNGSGGGPGCGNPGCVGSMHVFKFSEVNTRPRVISKPEPQYTEQARRDQIAGTVVLRVVFSSNGEVTNINAVQKLGGGLTEKAIAAARKIRFLPATRNGLPVSMYMQLEYNFNLY